MLPSTKLVVLGVLPRGWRGPSHFGVRPEKDFWYDWPNAFTQASTSTHCWGRLDFSPDAASLSDCRHRWQEEGTELELC